MHVWRLTVGLAGGQQNLQMGSRQTQRPSVLRRGYSDVQLHSSTGSQKGFLLDLNLRPGWKHRAKGIPWKVMQRNGQCGSSQRGGPDRQKRYTITWLCSVPMTKCSAKWPARKPPNTDGSRGDKRSGGAGKESPQGVDKNSRN